MIKAEIQRRSLISALTSKKLVVNLYSLDGVENLDDLDDIKIIFENYIKKYPTCGLRLDYRTNVLEKTTNIQKIALYINKLSASKFEKFSAFVAKLFEYKISYATKSSHDQGIDFVGIKDFKVFDSNRKSYLVGQAKKYTSLVEVHEVRGFAGSVLLLRNREFSQSKEVYKSILMKSFTSIEGIFATSYFFSKPASTLCENSDIIFLDFIDLVLLTEKAINTKELEIENKGIFVASKTDKAISEIEVLK